MDVFGVHLIGVTWENVRKLALSTAWIALALTLRWGIRRAVSWLNAKRRHERLAFWARQVAAILAATLIGLGLVSIWFDNPARLALPLGIITAGVAFALQKVITALAGYVIVLRGKTFQVGDRIEMGGVRGDVIALGFVQTTLLEMGQPPHEGKDRDQPPAWVQSRQYTGRVVTVTNDKVFENPVHNYSRHFSFIWEELRLPISYEADRARAEQILLESARRATADVHRMSQAERARMEREFFVDLSECNPRVYYRLTDNWLELTVRFIVEPRGIRDVLDRMTRDILDDLERAGIRVASQTYDVVGLPPLRLDGPMAERLTVAVERMAEGPRPSHHALRPPRRRPGPGGRGQGGLPARR